MFKLGLVMLLLAAGEEPRAVAIIESAATYNTEALCKKAGQAAMPYFGIIMTQQGNFIVGAEFQVQPICKRVNAA